MDESTVVSTLARAVRSARDARGWTQDELSRRAGVSKGALVAVEHGTTNPNLSTLCRLSDALGLPVSSLLDTPAGDVVEVVDVATLPALWTGPAGGTANLVLSTRGAAPVELWRWRLHPGESYDTVPYPEGVVRTVSVVGGTFVLVVDGTRHELHEGMTATFSGALPHGYRGGGDGPSTMLATTHLPEGGTW
ncbi:XRE family transcriptional regulator [Patulibacter sp. NPDC049589]|uniref:helix-turn-helix domain-containing protein n=1 Tax=Patulibacter sp. NPDC049589 TaxID=3154731 RepID=UPI0034234C21